MTWLLNLRCGLLKLLVFLVHDFGFELRLAEVAVELRHERHFFRD